MKAGCASIVVLPVREKSRQKPSMERDIESLIDVFRELHEVEKMTGRVGLAVRVRLAVSDILAGADRMAKEGRI